MDPSLPLGPEASRQRVARPHIAGVPSRRSCPHAHFLLGGSHSHAVAQAKASWPFHVMTDPALGLASAPAPVCQHVWCCDVPQLQLHTPQLLTPFPPPWTSLFQGHFEQAPALSTVSVCTKGWQQGL